MTKARRIAERKRRLGERRAADLAKPRPGPRAGPDPWAGGGPGAPANWDDDDAYEDAGPAEDPTKD